MFLSKNFLYLKKEKNLSYRDIVQNSGVSLGSLQALIKSNALTSIKTANKLAKYFNVTLDDLVNTDLEKLKERNN